MLRQRQRLKASPSQQKNAGAMLGLFLGSQMVQMLAPTWFGDELAWQFKVTIQFLLLFFVLVTGSSFCLAASSYRG
jgi:hypothetical protein